jgi:DeoR/GlpR family transcriptional regulator of sugar metabolism
MAGESAKVSRRRQLIIEKLDSEQIVWVAQLSKDFNISKVTVRNDLSSLEEDGLVRRIPGGAVPFAGLTPRTRGGRNEPDCSREKAAISKAAAELIRDGEVVMINSGSTALLTAKELRRHRHLKIVTNSLPIANELGDVPTIQIIFLGGQLNHTYGFTYGEDSISQLQKYKADTLILSVDGVRGDIGLTTYHAEEAKLIRAMMERSRSTVVVADHRKINHESFSYLGPINDVSTLVTDESSDPSALEQISSKGAHIITCGLV